ncbi:hypothetical protein BLNAU_12003 [Blattamonas nauphoetae]|uniref:Uncharacterized protein n=1 Tax=Blattamonas nauphoetae TaxID=2049346 RepID=A0ABQ9XML9_9EUKA|nr:hypothetical protein BLNAU_12003 [Blattamonas nauphoetae]
MRRWKWTHARCHSRNGQCCAGRGVTWGFVVGWAGLDDGRSVADGTGRDVDDTHVCVGTNPIFENGVCSSPSPLPTLSNHHVPSHNVFIRRVADVRFSPTSSHAILTGSDG